MRLRKRKEERYSLPGMMSSDDLAPESDRRRASRAPIELKVEYKRLNTFFADYTKNISRGGTFIGTEKPLAIGTEFVFALVVPHMAEALRLRGKVIWTTSTEDATRANPAGMGIEFQYASDAERSQKEAAVERLLIAELGEHLATKLLGRKPQA
jgi:type IV pilus assembly protein PilZ